MTSKFAPYVAGAAAVLALTAGTFATHAPAAQAFYWLFAFEGVVAGAY